MSEQPMEEALDFAVECLCGARAVAFLELHAVDACLLGDPTYGSFRCQGCLDSDLARVDEIAATGEEWCSNCGLTIHDRADMVTRIALI